MLLRFTKMHGAGNDFVVLDGVTQRLRLRPRDIRRLADRQRGIGCDQVLVVEPPGDPAVDFRYRIFNADGREVAQCGNGARCFARFVHHRKLSGKSVLLVETATGSLTLRYRDHNDIEATLGIPAFEPAQVPLRRESYADSYRVEVGEETLELAALSLGNPHAVLRVDDVAAAPVERIGADLNAHPDFPEGVNVGFLAPSGSGHGQLRVYERGVGETLACGSGACAAAIIGLRRGWFEGAVTLALPGGELTVSWDGDGTPVRLAGPTAIVFEGTIRL